MTTVTELLVVEAEAAMLPALDNRRWAFFLFSLRQSSGSPNQHLSYVPYNVYLTPVVPLNIWVQISRSIEGKMVPGGDVESEAQECSQHSG
jgi:hypothetical protein